MNTTRQRRRKDNIGRRDKDYNKINGKVREKEKFLIRNKGCILIIHLIYYIGELYSLITVNETLIMLKKRPNVIVYDTFNIDNK